MVASDMALCLANPGGDTPHRHKGVPLSSIAL